jgi:hypothetical protein
MDLRGRMPSVAAFVDDLRGAFGAEAVNDSMRGRNGGWFCAEESGLRWCTPGRTCTRCEEKAVERQ